MQYFTATCLGPTVTLLLAFTCPGNALHDVSKANANTTVFQSHSTVRARNQPQDTQSKATPSKREPDFPSYSTRANEATEQKLMQLVDVNYGETTIGEISEELQANYGLSLMIDQSAKDDSCSIDERVTFRCQQLRLKTALRLMLKGKNATYIIDEGVLRIISVDVADDPTFHTRQFFPVADLVHQIAVAQKATRKQKAVGQAGINIFIPNSHHLKPRGGVFSKPPSLPGIIAATQAPANASRQSGGENEPKDEDQSQMILKGPIALVHNSPQDPAEVLVEQVKMHIKPNDWYTTNGDGRAQVLAGVLIVTATTECQDKIQDFLDDLRHQMPK